MLAPVPVALSVNRVDPVAMEPLGSDESMSTMSSMCSCNPSGFLSLDPFLALFSSLKRVKTPWAGEGRCFMLTEPGEE